MRPSPKRPIRAALVAAMLAAALPLPAAAGPEALVPTTLQPADPCAFYRGQAYGKGLMHFATEMLWACQAIAARGAAGIPLGDRLQAMAAALERYRDAFVDAGRADLLPSRAGGYVPAARRLDEAGKRALAEDTGALAALDGIRTGF